MGFVLYLEKGPLVAGAGVSLGWPWEGERGTLCSKLSSSRDFSSASGFGLSLVFAACCQPSVHCDQGEA